MDGFESLGADEVGFDFGELFKTAGGVAQYGISSYETDKKEKETAATEKKSASDAIAADAAAAEAVAKADVSAQLKSDSATMDGVAAQRALELQLTAGAGLTADAQKKRAEAADKALDNAIKEAQAKPKDAYAAARVKAWTTVSTRAHAGAIVASDKPSKGGGESWLTKRVMGPVPGYGVLAIGAGLLGVAGVVVKKLFLK